VDRDARTVLLAVLRRLLVYGQGLACLVKEIEFYQRRIAENTKALDNTLKAIETGVVTETLPKRVKELEEEKYQLYDELERAENRRIILTPDRIEYLLLQYANKGEDEQGYKKEVIDSFVSQVYLYDNKLLIYYNINEDHFDLTQSDLTFAESEVFDQQSDCLTNRPLDKLISSRSTSK